uniref:Uncharacterized protein n=1 Tax=Anguilla anguilla TaxID=7936 RepID=A0A0E9T7Q5_ANGAN
MFGITGDFLELQGNVSHLFNVKIRRLTFSSTSNLQLNG